MDNPEKLGTKGTQDTIRRQTNRKHSAICFAHHYTQTNTNNVNKKWVLLQITGDKDDSNIILCDNRVRHLNTERRL